MQVDGTKERVLMRRFAADSFPQLYLVDTREGLTRQYNGIRAVEQVHFGEDYLLNTLMLPAQRSAVRRTAACEGWRHRVPMFAAGGVCSEGIQGSGAAALLCKPGLHLWPSCGCTASVSSFSNQYSISIIALFY